MSLSDLPSPKWVASGKQVILKSDFQKIEEAILEPQPRAAMPSLVLVDVGTIRVEAQIDSPAKVGFSGFSNIYEPASPLNGGLSDEKYRSNTSNVSCIFGSGDLWGTEQIAQWYAIFGLAQDIDTSFTLKAMPYLRVKNQTGQIIKTGTIVTPATGRNYGFTDNEFAGSLIYVLSGVSKGLLRTITANGLDTDTTVTYSGVALSLTAGDWFIIFPPGTNFRRLGDIFNNAAGDIERIDDIIAGKFPYHFNTIGTTYWVAPLSFASDKTVQGSGTGGGGGGGGGDGATYGGSAGINGKGKGQVPLSPVAGTVYLITIGINGNGGTVGNSGSAGGTSSIGSLFVCVGGSQGSAGTSSTGTGIPGLPSPIYGDGFGFGGDGGDYNLPGNNGGSGSIDIDL